jgi:hypothetical protein
MRIGGKARMQNAVDVEHRIVDAIYRGAYEPAELTRAIELIAQYFNSAGAVLAQLDQVAPEGQLTIGVRAVDQTFFANYAPYAPLDPAPLAYAALPTGSMSTTDRMFSRDALRQCVFLNEFLRPNGVEAALGGPIVSTGGRFAMISILQASGRDPFDSDDIARLERITPHLTRALQIRRLFLQGEERSRVLESIVNRNPTGFIGLTSSGSASFVNDAARRIAAENDGITLDSKGRPLVGDRTAARRLAQLQADISRGGAGGIVRLQRPSGRPPYIVLVSPLPAGHNIVPGVNSGSGVLVAIHDPGRQAVSNVQHLAQVLHLPRGAAKLLGAILDGVELKDYADRESISMNTVKFHLKTAFERTGTRSQVELVRRTLLALNDVAPYFRD